MNFTKPERRWVELLILLGLVIVTTPLFWFTDLDQQIAGIFYQPGKKGPNAWPWQHSWLLDNLFRYATVFSVTIAVSALLLALSGLIWPNIKRWQKPALFIVLVIALGPGLVVNLVFKDNWGRPRPVHLVEFGGKNTYLPPLKIGNTPHKSFPCGHCSVGFMFFALYFLSTKRKTFYFALTLFFGLMMAITRMTAGGHFISDILWSGYLVFLVNWLVYYGWYDRAISGNKKEKLNFL
jgi:lipid A 4'-phosphatase